MSKTNNTKNSKFSFSNIIRDNRVIFLASVIISFALWTWVSVQKSPIVQKTITDVPVVIDLNDSVPEQLNLQIFGDKEFKVDVTVSGKKYILASLDKDDILITANTNYVDSAGSKTLQLKYAVADGSDDFEIVGLSSTYVQVYFDIYKQVELPLETNFVNDVKPLLDEDCILGDLVYSKQAITVSGPASEINRINKALATVNITDKLEKNTTVVPKIEIVTEDNSSLKYSQIETGGDDITISMPVLKIVTLPTSVDFRNTPEFFVSNPIKYSVYPSTITAAIPIDLVETTKSLPVCTIDYSEIARGLNTFNVSASDIDNYKIQSSVDKFRITVDATEFSTKTFLVSASNVKIINANPNYNVKNTEKGNLELTVVGKADVLEDLIVDDFTITADLQSVVLSENVSKATANVTVKNGKAWVHGKPEISIAVSEK